MKKKSLYDEINEEFSRLIDEDAILMGAISSPDSGMVSNNSETISDNSILTSHGKVDDHSITFSDTLGDYKPGDGVMSAKNNYTGNGLSAMAIQKRVKESDEILDEINKEIIKLENDETISEDKTLRNNIMDRNYKQYFLESDIQGLEHYSENELKKKIIDFIFGRLDSKNISDKVFIEFMSIVGSRNRNTALEDSDLDVVVQYSGDIKEKEFAKLLNDIPLKIDNIVIDIKPINQKESGSIKDFLKKSKEYDDYVLSNVGETLTEKKKKQKKRKRQHFRRWFGYYPFWPIRPMLPPPGPPPPKPQPDPTPTPDPTPDVPSGGDVGGDIGGAPAGGDVGGSVSAGPVGEAIFNGKKDSIEQIIKDLKNPIDSYMRNEMWSYEEIVDLCSEYADRLEAIMKEM